MIRIKKNLYNEYIKHQLFTSDAGIKSCLPVLNLFVRKQNQVFYKAWLLDLLQYLRTSTSSWLIFFSRFFSNLIFFIHVPDVKKKKNNANTDISLGWRFTDSKSSVCETQNRVFFTRRHGGHIGVPKQWNGGHVGVPNQSSGSWTLFLCKRFLLFQ